MKRKICKNCKLMFTEENCPGCGSNQYTQSFQGRLTILNVEKSEIAKKVGVTKPGEYAIKIR